LLDANAASEVAQMQWSAPSTLGCPAGRVRKSNFVCRAVARNDIVFSAAGWTAIALHGISVTSTGSDRISTRNGKSVADQPETVGTVYWIGEYGRMFA
jgi:hypothetical protein